MACVLALSSADTATVGASATELRSALHISNTDIGLLVAVSAVVAALASVPFGILADRFNRTRLLGASIVLWGVAMVFSATVGSFGRLLLARLFLGIVTAVAGPTVASLVGDYFPSSERGRIYGWILTGELLGAGVGFAVTGDIAALSWRAAFVILAIPTFVLARFAFKLPEPVRGGARPLLREGAPGAESPSMSHAEQMAAEVQAEQDDTSTRETDAQRLARERGVDFDHELVEQYDVEKLGFVEAVRYILRVRTNVILIVASSLGYFYLAGLQTFGSEFAREEFSINQALANALLLVVGGGAVIGVLAAGHLSDAVLRRGHLNARILITGVAALGTVAMFIPALITRSPITALPYLIFAAFFLSAQNPPIDAARLDIMPALLWGRAEGVRTALRTGAQALAPILFGFVADTVFGGGRSGLRWAFIVMLLPLTANGVILLRGMRTYPRDVATAAAATQRSLERSGAGSSAANGGDPPGDPTERPEAGWQPSGGSPQPSPPAQWPASTAGADPTQVAPGKPFTDRWGDETAHWPNPPRLPPANWTEPDR